MIVLDASVAAKLVLTNEANADKAAALAQDCARRAEPLVAPPLLPSEVANVLRQRMRRASMPLSTARLLLADFLALSITLIAPADLYDRALRLADQYHLPAAYDAHYLALAQILGCDLWTDDQRLVSTLAGALTFVKWLGSYQPSQPPP
jgi:predicted nucleic acid-binding protein